MPSVSPYALAALAGIWLADGIALLIAPRFLVEQTRELVRQSPAILWWELWELIGGLFLLFASQDLPHRSLWIVTAGGMISKGAFLSFAPGSWRDSVLTWCISRDAVDYRLCGMGLCTLAVLLLHALGWIGRT